MKQITFDGPAEYRKVLAGEPLPFFNILDDGRDELTDLEALLIEFDGVMRVTGQMIMTWDPDPGAVRAEGIHAVL